MGEKPDLTLGRPRGSASKRRVLFFLIVTLVLVRPLINNVGLAQEGSVKMNQHPEQPKQEAVAEAEEAVAEAEEAVGEVEEAVAEAEEAVAEAEEVVSEAEEAVSEAEQPRALVSRATIRISMDFQDVPLKQILKIFSQQAGLNFVASGQIENRQITLYLDNVRVDDALTHILKANGLIYEQKEDSDIFLVKDAGVPKVDTITRIYQLSYATVTGVTVEDEGEEEGEYGEKGIEEVLRGLITENGKLMTDTRTNSLIISDISSRFEMIERVIAELDTKPFQVMICAEILEVGLDTMNKLGVEWGLDSTGTAGPLLTYTAPSKGSFFPFPFEKQLFSGKGGPTSVTMGTLTLQAFQSYFHALITESDTHYLARPRLLTLNNMTAEINISQDATVGTKTIVSGGGEGVTTSTTSAERAPIGTILKVTPQISKEGYVTMTIEPEVSRSKAASITGYYDPYKRSAKTTVLVKDGDTIVIAGLISREDSAAVQKVPVLGDIPILGVPFRRTTEDKEDTEIIIFITPHIVKEEGGYLAELAAEYGLDTFPAMAPAPVKASEKREQTEPIIIAREQEPLSSNK